MKTVTIRIKGLSFLDTPFYTVLLTHQGNPRFVDVYGGVREFKHRKRTLFQFYKNGESETFDLGGLEGRYAYLSPFATWTISIFGSSENVIVPIADIEELGLTFSGVAFARYL
ncbi:hypothetical protein [Chitinophaga ginsengisoli]|uniref:Uncharacterized protein n=1 Tax=Chitinophaga ginsengisoli TaxID=363837 RepID=A0A2P8GKM8_9BACT|nr:hypothetical protein [Chitinophaga ginsengisoli]PSL34527.1 hypothetical protein CLV42_10298 [Chitinophaga ginsengisoli]